MSQSCDGPLRESFTVFVFRIYDGEWANEPDDPHTSIIHVSSTARWCHWLTHANQVLGRKRSDFAASSESSLNILDYLSFWYLKTTLTLQDRFFKILIQWSPCTASRQRSHHRQSAGMFFSHILLYYGDLVLKTQTYWCWETVWSILKSTTFFRASNETSEEKEKSVFSDEQSNDHGLASTATSDAFNSLEYTRSSSIMP